MCASVCAWTIVCEYIWENGYECEHTHIGRHTQAYTVEFLVTEDCRCSSLTLKVAVDTKRHSVGVWWISVRPTWKAVQNTDRPRILMGGMCVCVCVCERERDTVRGRKRNQTCVWQVVCVYVTRNATQKEERGARVCMSESFFTCACVCAHVSVIVHAFVRLCMQLCAFRLFILCSLQANQQRPIPASPASYQSSWC